MSDTPDSPGPALPDWATFGLAADIRPALAEALARGEASALCTLYSAQGGTPRPVGAQMLVTADTLAGFLSGGCVEGDVASHARAVIADGQPRQLVYGEGGPPDIKLLCGARIEVFVERIDTADLAAHAVVELAAARRPAVWRSNGWLRACTAGTVPGLVAIETPFSLTLPYAPPPRLIVVGADPIALAIASLALTMGLETHLVRPKGPDSPPPLEGLIYHRTGAAQAFEVIGLDAWTHVAVATHDTETDEAALIAALRTEAAYVGVLGARRRIPERFERLRAQGFGADALARIRAPIGLDLGGKAPFEVAVAVMAEIIARTNGRD